MHQLYLFMVLGIGQLEFAEILCSTVYRLGIGLDAHVTDDNYALHSLADLLELPMSSYLNLPSS